MWATTLFTFLGSLLAAGSIGIPAQGQQPPNGIHVVSKATARVGVASAVDGATILLDGTAIRLWGIDAPELSTWPWGPYAHRHLDELLETGPKVLCEPRGHIHNRIAAQCWFMDAGIQVTQGEYLLTGAARDIGALLISTGYAMEYRSLTRGYMPYREREKIARARKLGVWRE